MNYIACQSFLNHTYQKFPNSSRNTRIILNKIFNFAMKMNILERNPLPECKVRKKEQVQDPRDNGKDYISKEKFKEILNSFSDYPGIQTALMLGYYLGLRISEILALTWEDFDFEDKTVLIHSQLDYDGVPITELKTKSSYSIMPLSNPLINYLTRIMPASATGRCCLDEKGNPYNTRQVQYLVRNSSIKFHFHQLRHTFITNVLLVSNPKTAATLARHSSVKTTLNLYTEITQERKKDVVNEAFANFGKGKR